jgi:hypothetical protein
MAPQFLLPDEDVVASPIHLLLFLAAWPGLLLGMAGPGGPPRVRLAQLASVVVVGFALFCLLIKWQYWGSRLLLPLGVLSSPIVGHWLARSSLAWFRSLVALLLAANAVGYSLVPFRRPLVALPEGWCPAQSPSILGLRRSDIYFSSHLADGQRAFGKMVDRLAADGCRSVGLNLGALAHEYALWVLAAERMGAGVRFRNIEVQNRSGRLDPEFPDSETCARIVLVLRPQGPG